MGVKIQKDKIVRGILDNYKLVPHLNRAIQEAGDFSWRYEFEVKKGDKAFHPSSHCLPEPVELYNMMTDPEPQAIGASLRKTFAIGHMWHAYLYQIIVKQLGFADENEIECHGTKVWGLIGGGAPKPYHYSQGHADIAKCSIPKHGDFLIDIKTMNEKDFKTGGLPARFADKYICQANIYMAYFDMEKALILKVQKDSPHEFAEVELHRNQKLIDTIYEKWKVMSYFLTEGIAPSAELKFPLEIS